MVLAAGLAGALLFAAAACGGGDDTDSPTSIGRWKADWVQPLAIMSEELDNVRTAQTGSDPTLIGESCRQLATAMEAAADALPVPDIDLNGLLRQAFDELEPGTEDCQVESSITQLGQARESLDAALAAIARLP